MNKYLFALLFLFSPVLSSAQTSIGFSDSTDFQFLIDYRLPDWGYSNFYLASGNLGLSGSSNIRDNEFTTNAGNLLNDVEDEARNAFGSISVTPAFESFRQSEERTYLLYTSLDIGANSSDRTNINRDNINDIENERIRNDRNRFARLDAGFNTQRYLAGDFYVNSELYTSVRYNSGRFLDEFNNIDIAETRSLRRDIFINPSLGIGVGRIRNVTPILRALRLNERYKTLGNSSLNGAEITGLAEQFTRYNGYQNRYDRPLKYFWDDLNTQTNGKLDNLGAFDILYLNDVFAENMGSRFEGYSISLNTEYRVNSRMDRIEDELNNTTTRDVNISRQAELNLIADWYKNLDLENQISASLLSSMSFPLERADALEWDFVNSVTLRWLWILTDRFRLNNTLSNSFRRSKLKDSPDESEYSLSTGINSGFTYFIENKMSFSAGFMLSNSYLNFKNDTVLGTSTIKDTAWIWGFNAGLRYYFNRNLY